MNLYTDDVIYDDIALVEVNGTITMQPYHIAPICLPQYDYHYSREEYGIVAGWGYLDMNGTLPQSLQMGWVKINKNSLDEIDNYGKNIIVRPQINGTVSCLVNI